MIETPTETKKRGRIARHWGKATAVAVALTAFLGWYVGIRDQGHLFLCDVAGLVGQKEVLPICRDEEAAPDETDPVALIEYLEAREDQLNPEQLEKLRRVKSRFADRTIEKLMEAVGLVGAPVDAEAEADTREAVRETVEEGDAEERRALAMIADGDLDGGLRLLSDLASASAVENAAQWRRIGRLAYAVDTAQALGAYEKVFALDQSDPWDAIYLGRLYERAGSFADARRTYADALGRLPEAKERDRAVLLNEIGDVLVAQGDLSGALESYRASLAIIERLAEADPNNAGWRRDLSVSHNNIGDVLVAQGDLSGALESYRASLAIAERLVETDPNNAGWRRDLSVSHNKVGDVLKRQGDLSGALESYRASLAIAERLVETDPNNAGWRRDLSVSYERIGDLEDARGDIVAAIAAYEKSLPIAQSLADRFPDHPGFQSDIVITKRRLTELRAKFD